MLQHHVVPHQDRHHNNWIFAAPAAMHADSRGEAQFGRVGQIVFDRAAIDLHGKDLVNGIDPFDAA